MNPVYLSRHPLAVGYKVHVVYACLHVIAGLNISLGCSMTWSTNGFQIKKKSPPFLISILHKTILSSLGDDVLRVT